MTGSEVATLDKDQQAELEALQGEADRLAAQKKADIGTDEIALPLIKLTQGLSKEVEQGIAKPGEFVNSVTGRNYGKELELVIVEKFPGHFYSPKGTDKAWSAANTDFVPDFWPDEYAGKRFSELDDAEDRYKERVNAGDIEWGNGPPISKTRNFVGYVRGETDLPVRISLMRTSAGAATTISTLLKIQPAFWSRYVKLTVGENVNGEGQKSHKVLAQESEAVTDEDTLAAIKLAIEIEKSKQFVLVGDEADAEGGQVVKPEAGAGAVEID